MYYKLLQDGAVVDVLVRDKWLCYQDKHGMLVPCDAECANGILADNGNVNHVDGLPEIPIEDIETVYAITRAEYLALADMLGKTVQPLLEDVPILREQNARQQADIDYLYMMTDLETEAEA